MNNSNIFLNLLEAGKVVDPCIRVLSVGSSWQYGIVSADNGKINSRTGWSPEISFESGLTDLFEYWMARL